MRVGAFTEARAIGVRGLLNAQSELAGCQTKGHLARAVTGLVTEIDRQASPQHDSRPN